MKRISFFNQKGGVGKTGSTVHIAGCLEKEHEARVLVVDCDPSGNCGSFLNQIAENDLDYTLEDCMKGDVPIEDCIYPVYVRGSHRNDEIPPMRISVDFIPSTESLYETEVDDVLFLKKELEAISDRYDYVLFDCPPERSPMTVCALCASDYIVIPVMPDIDSMDGYGMALELITKIRQSRYNETISILGVFLNQYDVRLPFESNVLKECREAFEDDFFETIIRDSTEVRQSRYFGEPCCYYKPSGRLSKDYQNVTNELLKRIQERKGKVGR